MTMITDNAVYCMDALDLLKQLPDNHVDMILTDPPYGQEKTKLGWDVDLDLTALFTEFRRVIHPQGAILIFAAPPFSYDVFAAARDIYRYEWVMEKSRGSNFGTSKYQPLRVTEYILAFSLSPANINQHRDTGNMRYYPQVELQPKSHQRIDRAHHVRVANPNSQISSHVQNSKADYVHEYKYYHPRNLLKANMDTDEDRGLHPTQKDRRVCEYLVNTYTKPGMLVLDCFCGSGTTGVAARNLNRRYILGDTDAGYCEIARQRLALPFTLPLFD